MGPAVDVLEGRAVRLERGDYERVTAEAGDPLALIARLAAARPPLLHVVALGAARDAAYRGVDAVRLEGGRYRTDIAAREVPAGTAAGGSTAPPPGWVVGYRCDAPPGDGKTRASPQRRG